ncbi:Bcr/CflA family multidrug efflux MFS transporter [Catenulispora yoronensis]|uniref:Bcr/CflA family multidrug efflux MFS transporter n=1 Tax=Catenulispora yoronensis TaxID=450799 RepID=UPI0031D988DC
MTTAQRAPRKLLLILGALSMFGPLSLDMYLPALPDLAHSFHTPESNVQLTLTSCLIGLAVGQLVAGPMSDAWGRKKPLVIGLIAYAVTSAFCAVAPEVFSLAAVRFLQGFAGAAGLVISRAMVRDLYQGDALTKFFSTLMLVNGLAPILAPVLGGQLTRFMSWRGVFVVLALIGVALLLATLFGLKESLPKEARNAGGGGLPATLRTFRVLTRDRRFMGYILTGGFAFAAMFAYISGSPFVLEDIHGLTKQEFSYVFGTNALGIMIAGQVGGRLVGRIPSARILGSGLALSLTGSTVLLAATVLAGGNLAGTLLGLFLMVSAIGLIMPQITALALSGYAPAVAGAASAMIGTGQFLLGAVFAPLVGLGGKSSGLPMAVVIFALSLGAVLMRVLLVRTPRVELVAEPLVA